MSFPWATPALLTSTVGWPTYTSGPDAVKGKGRMAYLLDDYPRYCLNLFPFCDITFVVSDVI